ncbi:MAG: membrane protein insertion efficiency factor YidD [Pseudohongiellaceae bacterium]
MIKNFLISFLTLLIKLYQVSLGLLLGHQCRFYPTCSEYTMQAITQHGPVRGLWLGLRRIGRCHPWCEGGVDIVPAPRSQPAHAEAAEQK